MLKFSGTLTKIIAESFFKFKNSLILIEQFSIAIIRTKEEVRLTNLKKGFKTVYYSVTKFNFFSKTYL